MREYASRGSTIHLHNGGLTRGDGSINLSKGRGSLTTGNDGFDAHLRIKLADGVPANTRARETLDALEFLIEGLGGFGISMSAQHHGHAGEGAADIADGVRLLFAEAEPVTFPLWVLL